MKKTLLFITIGFLAFTTNLQAQSFQKGDHLVKGGIGFPTIIGSIFSTYESNAGYKATSIMPLYVKYEHALTDKIGLGLNIAYSKNKASYTETVSGNNYETSVSRTSISALARLNFHFANNSKFDPYFGPAIGYRSANWKFETTDPNGTNSGSFPNLIPFGMEFTIGANYYITDNIGLYAEAGLAKSPIQFGFAAKF